MSEYRTHLQESVAAAVSGLQRLAETLGSEVVDTDSGSAGRHTPASATPSPSKGDVSHPLPSPSPAPSAPAPRRWWLNVYNFDGRVYMHDSAAVAARSLDGGETIPVVEASALEEAEQRAAMLDIRNGHLRGECTVSDIAREKAEAARDDALARLATAERERNDAQHEKTEAYVTLAAVEQELDAARAQLREARVVTKEQVRQLVMEYYDHAHGTDIATPLYRDMAKALTKVLGFEVRDA